MGENQSAGSHKNREATRICIQWYSLYYNINLILNWGCFFATEILLQSPHRNSRSRGSAGLHFLRELYEQATPHSPHTFRPAASKKNHKILILKRRARFYLESQKEKHHSATKVLTRKSQAKAKSSNWLFVSQFKTCFHHSK